MNNDIADAVLNRTAHNTDSSSKERVPRAGRRKGVTSEMHKFDGKFISISEINILHI